VSLTNAAEEEDDEEGARHRDDGADEDVEDAADCSEAGHHAKHPAASKQQHESQRQVDWGETDEGDADHNEVEHTPSILKEGPKPTTEKVDAELRREDEDKDGVEPAQEGDG
jgi:hypothetical protein